ncbi:MAG: DUF5666 domain-containing protein [Terracidiphilus sp.]
MSICGPLRLCLAVVLLAPIATVLRAQNAPPGAPRRIGVGTIHGMAGLVQSVTPSQILFTVEEHVTFAANVSAATQFIQDGQPATLSDIQPGGWIFVNGDFDLAAHTVSAGNIRLTPPLNARPLQRLFDTFGTSWTAGTITALRGASITVQHMDGSAQTLDTDQNTSYRFLDRPADATLLRLGERIQVLLQPGNPSLATRVTIHGMAR